MANGKASTSVMFICAVRSMQVQAVFEKQMNEEERQHKESDDEKS